MLNIRSAKIKPAKNLSEQRRDDLQNPPNSPKILLKGNFTFTSSTRNMHLLINYVHETIVGLGVLINIFKEELNHYNQ